MVSVLDGVELELVAALDRLRQIIGVKRITESLEVSQQEFVRDVELLVGTGEGNPRLPIARIVRNDDLPFEARLVDRPFERGEPNALRVDD